MAAIPTLEARNPSHRVMYTRFQREVMACAQKVTVMCGAGISRKAGLQDFRSPDGIYNTPLGDSRILAGSDLFASSTLRDKQKLCEFGRLLTQMRVIARQAVVPDCHRWIAHLHRIDRLVRCYTQNIDGLQTRDFDGMGDVVVELHGTNVYLKCHKCNRRPREPASVFDRQLLEEGSAVCTLCSIQPERTGSGMKLRARVPGLLLPEVLLNEDSNSPSKEGKTLDRMKEEDSDCDLLLILGTSLKSHGAAGLVRDLANLVHARGGMVVYVNLTSLSSSSWYSYVDLHIRVDVEEWANENLAHLHHGSQVEDIVLRSEVSLRVRMVYVLDPLYQLIKYKVMSIIESVKALPIILRDVEAGSAFQVEISGTNKPTEMLLQRLHTSDPLDLIAASTTELGDTGVVFLVCHHSWALSEAHALQVLLIKECSTRLVPCTFHLFNVERAHQRKIVIPEWRDYLIIPIFITRLAQLVKMRSFHSARAEMDVFKILSRCFDLTLPLLLGAKWGTVIIFGEDEAWAQEAMLESMSKIIEKVQKIESGVGAFPSVLAGIGTQRLRLGGWASFIAKMVSLDFDKEYRTLEEIAVALWMATDDFFEHTDLKVWSDSGSPYLLISAPFEQRPLGRSLPPVETAGCCAPDPEKKWLMTHNAVHKGELKKIHQLKKIDVTVKCSRCGHSLHTRSTSLNGWIHYDSHKHAVQVPCQI